MPILQVGKLMVSMATIRILFETVRLIAAVEQVGSRTNLVLYIACNPSLCAVAVVMRMLTVAMGVHLLTFDVARCVFYTHGIIEAGVWVVGCVGSVAG